MSSGVIWHYFRAVLPKTLIKFVLIIWDGFSGRQSLGILLGVVRFDTTFVLFLIFRCIHISLWCFIKLAGCNSIFFNVVVKSPKNMSGYLVSAPRFEHGIFRKKKHYLTKFDVEVKVCVELYLSSIYPRFWRKTCFGDFILRFYSINSQSDRNLFFVLHDCIFALMAVHNFVFLPWPKYYVLVANKYILHEERKERKKERKVWSLLKLLRVITSVIRRFVSDCSFHLMVGCFIETVWSPKSYFSLTKTSNFAR